MNVKVPGSGRRGCKPATTRTTARFWTGVLAPICLAAGLSAHAVIFFSTGDPAYNTTAPTGNLAGSGWQWQGRWGGFLGTAVAPDFFLTAGHVGGGTGQMFQFNGQNYLAVASYLAPNADLRLWRVAGVLPGYAPRYAGFSERNQPVVVFGCGTQRGEPVVVDGKTKGWLWGLPDGRHRWGTNTVAEVVDFQEQVIHSHDPQPGDMLACTFDADAGDDEVTLSGGDSGGGMFLLENGQWKLAGICRTVQSDFRRTADGETFTAAIFDAGGLYEETTRGVWKFQVARPVDQPAAFFTARVSGNESWIASVLAGQLPPEKALVVYSSESVAGPYALETAAVLNAAKSQFNLPAHLDTRFYQLRSDFSVKIHSITASAGTITLKFAP